VKAKRREFGPLRDDPARVEAFLRDLVPTAREFDAGPLGEGSLFFKTLSMIRVEKIRAKGLAAGHQDSG
jgi:hypothetical protein